MALKYTVSSTDKVNCGHATALAQFSQYTLASWVYPNALSLNKQLCTKDPNVATAVREWSLRSSGQIDLFTAAATTNVSARSANSAGNKVTTGKWWFIVCLMTSGLVPHLYLGDLTTEVYETTYATQTTGVGALTDDSTYDFKIGNGNADSNAPDVTIACMAYLPTALSLNQLKALQFNFTNLFAGSTGGLWHLFGPTLTQPDLMGNGNNGTVTGTTVDKHVPFPVIRYPGPVGWQGNLKKPRRFQQGAQLNQAVKRAAYW